MDEESNKIIDYAAQSKWGVRHKLIFKLFLMCVLIYSCRFNLSIGIVAMVDDTDIGDNLETGEKHEIMCPSLLAEPHNLNESVFIYVNNNATVTDHRNLYSSLNQTENQPSKHHEKPLGQTFRWNEKDQGLVLGSFFWGYMVSQFPAGLLAYKYGGKWVAGLGMIWTGLLSIALPQAALVGGRDFVILVRVLQGLSSGFVVPALVVLLAKWTPPLERARLSAVCMAGLPLGTAMTMIVSGYLIPAFGWPAVFYAPGLLTILWFIMWCYTVHSCPEDDPSVSPEELKYFQSSFSTESTTSDENGVVSHEMCSESTNLSDVPWKAIATSVPIWAIFTSQFCSAWGHNMLKSEGPKYLHSALHFDIHANSYFSALPYICQFLFMMAVGCLSDFLIEKKILSMIHTRKLCNAIGQWGCALAFAGLILAGCNRAVAVICYILSGMINGAMISGAYVNIIDISPKYAGTIEGMMNSFANIAGFGAPYVAGLILHNEPSILGWNYVFLVPVISNIIGNIAFIMGASGKIQPWNYSRIDERKTDTCDIKTQQEIKNNNDSK